MANKIESYIRLSKIFSNHHFHLYLVGGCVRDYLLHRDFDDIDLTTDATPEDMKMMFPNADFSFAKYGAVKIDFESVIFEVTTLRIEKGYKDSRHPSKIVFTKDIKRDVVRRDFTINGIYMDDRFNVFDYVKGQRDLEKHNIRTIGRATRRFKEDPLRIIRAVRFALVLGFDIDPSTSKAMSKCSKYLSRLNPAKIHEEIMKITSCDENIKNELFKKYDISQFVNVC